MLGRNEDLRNYLFKAHGISRIALNVMFVTCLFIFPWLIVVVYAFLGKTSKGWAYFIPYYVLSIVALGAPAVIVFALMVHIAAWVNANTILTDIQGAARLRVMEIDQQPGSGDENLLEKGIISFKVFRENRHAIEVLEKVLLQNGGDANLLNQAGMFMLTNMRYPEAAEFFNRAYASAQDATLIRQITKNIRRVEKKLFKMSPYVKSYDLTKTVLQS